MYNPEKEYINNFSRTREEGLTNAEAEVIPKISSAYKETKPKLNDFIDVYSEEEIRQDKQKVKNAKKEHLEHTERSGFFEVVLAEHLEKSEWLGENATISPASEYDDFFNCVDLVAEFGLQEHGSDALKLAIDATTGVDSTACNEKIRKTKKRIANGKLASMKYFVSSEPELNSYKGGLEMIPKVIVGAPVEEVKKLAEKVKDIMDKKKGAQEAMGNHYIQIELLEEMQSQLEAFIRFAKDSGFSEEDKVVSNQKDVLDIIKEVLKEKSSIEMPDGARKNKFYHSLTEDL